MIPTKNEGFQPPKLDFYFLKMEFYLLTKKKAVGAAIY